MTTTTIRVENVGKLYRLGEVGTGTVSHDLNRWFARLRGKEDPFAKIGEVNDRTTKGNSDYVWALRDVSFAVEQGKAVGIIGRNGAGKSTLLKLLSKVTPPTKGRIKVKGRIASLLEVGTGFHPELSGRENIYLNGAILGMTKKEITRKFDDIVDFAGVERYIDTPVKRYSSGMYVRLAFAVAAYLESEVLIVDEVLAVGDAEFQKKCLGKMGDVTHKEGRTVLFVSHNMASIKNLCDSAILLNRGSIEAEGDTATVIDQYLAEGNEVERFVQWAPHERPSSPEVDLLSIAVLDDKGRMDSILTAYDDIRIEIRYLLKQEVRNLRVTVNFCTTDGIELISSSDFNFQPPSRIRKPGHYKSVCIVPKHLLNLGTLVAKVDFDIPKMKALLMDIPVSFTVSELAFNQLGITMGNRPAGVVHPYLEWEVHCEEEVLTES